MSIPPDGVSNSRTSTSSIRSSRPPVDRLALRGSRLRARELGILEEFWELVSVGRFAAALGRLELEERRQKDRTRRRKVRLVSALLLAVAGCVTVSWWLGLDGL